jgi:uncharacterized protein (UPF0332 family)
MTLSAQEKGDLARYRVNKAHTLLRDAENLIGWSSFASSANRSFFAVLTAAHGVLVLRGLDPESHECVRVILPREFGETYRVLQARRMDSDYGDYIEIGETEAKDSFEKAKVFVQAAEKVLEVLMKAG